MRKILAAFLLFLFLVSIPSNLRPDTKILCISDIHFDPFYDTTIVKDLIEKPYSGWKALFDAGESGSLGKYGEDANYNLLKSLMKDVSSKKNEFDLIIISGDFLSHEFNRNFFRYSGTNSNDSLKSFIEKTIYFIKEIFDVYLPGKYVLPALGNNDSFCGDYMIEPGGEFLKMFFSCWADKLPHQPLPDGALRGGYYDLYYPANSTNRFIILNTVFFSDKYSNKCGNNTFDPAEEQLKWLENILNESKLKNDKVWLIYHIAPGIDVYSTIEKDTVCKDKITTLWKEKITEKFLKIVYNHRDIINAQIAGHIHRDDFRVLLESGIPYSFIHLNPAVSPIYGNNPSYQLLTIDNSGFSIKNAESFYINISSNDLSWNPEYNFNIAYGEDGINPRTLMNVSNKILNNPEMRLKYFNYYTSFMDKDIAELEKDWLAYWCGIINLRFNEYEDCYCN